MSSTPLHYQRVLLKLSGEALKGKFHSGIDADTVFYLVEQVQQLHLSGVEVGIVIGGGNFFRGVGSYASWMNRKSADYIGMMSTMMNGVALREAFEHHQIPCALFSALPLEGVIDRYDYRAVQDALSSKKVVIFSGGTGHPFFSTDTAAALRGHEIDAQALIKVTKVDGVYDSDPEKNPDAKRIEQLTYLEVLEKDLRVMDATSISFCREYNIPIMVLDVKQPGHLMRAVQGERVGTLISNPEQD